MKRICALSFLMEMSGMLCFFTVPLLAVSFGISGLFLGYLGAAGVGTYMTSAFVSGHLAERAGAKRLAALGVVLIGCASAAALAASSISHLFLLTVGLNIGFGLFWAPFMTIVNRTGAPIGTARTVSAFSFALSLGGMVAPVFAGWLLQVWNRLPFLAALAGFFSVAAVLAGVEDNGGSAAESAPQQGKDGSIAAAFFGVCAVFIVAFGCLRGQFPKLAAEVGISARTLGILYTLMDASRTGVFALAGRHPGWFKRHGLIAAWTGVACLTLIGVVVSSSAWIHAVSFAAVGSAVGISYAYALHEVFRLRGGSGAVLGKMEAMFSFGMFAGSLSGGFAAWAFGIRGPYGFGCGLGVCAASVQALLFRWQQVVSPQGGRDGV